MDMDGRTVNVTYGRLETNRQVIRANALNMRLYGPGIIRANFEPRPYMGPAFRKEAPVSLGLWQDSVKP